MSPLNESPTARGEPRQWSILFSRAIVSGAIRGRRGPSPKPNLAIYTCHTAQREACTPAPAPQLPLFQLAAGLAEELLLPPREAVHPLAGDFFEELVHPLLHLGGLFTPPPAGPLPEVGPQ